MTQQYKTMDVETREYTRDLDGPKGKMPSVQTSTKEVSSWFYMGKVGQIGYTISLPIVAGALIGAYLDRLWSTYPKATLAGVFGGLFLSMVNFIRLIRELMR